MQALALAMLRSGCEAASRDEAHDRPWILGDVFWAGGLRTHLRSTKTQAKPRQNGTLPAKAPCALLWQGWPITGPYQLSKTLKR